MHLALAFSMGSWGTLCGSSLWKWSLRSAVASVLKVTPSHIAYKVVPELATSGGNATAAPTATAAKLKSPFVILMLAIALPRAAELQLALRHLARRGVKYDIARVMCERDAGTCAVRVLRVTVPNRVALAHAAARHAARDGSSSVTGGGVRSGSSALSSKLASPALAGSDARAGSRGAFGGVLLLAAGLYLYRRRATANVPVRAARSPLLAFFVRSLARSLVRSLSPCAND